jgi:hypothetical protein
MKFNNVILAGAALVTLGSFTGAAKADTVYTTVAPGTTVTTTSGPTKEYTHEQYTAIGTRKVGMVGYRPYPLVASKVDSRTVNVKGDSDTVVYRTVDGAPLATESSTVTTSTSSAPISYTSGGGTYYTTAGQKYYRDPALNINVRSTGRSFNN